MTFNNKSVDCILNNDKTHGESFEPLERNDGPVEFEDQLSFINDDKLNEEFSDDSIIWNVRQVKAGHPETTSSRILLNRQRVVGIDPNPARISYIFRKDTIRCGAYHENRYSFNRKGVLDKTHVDLKDWTEYNNINEFADKVPERWKIEKWSERLPLKFELEE